MCMCADVRESEDVRVRIEDGGVKMRAYMWM